MTKAKPITDLVSDLRAALVAAKAATGPEVVYSLQVLGPWWTGNFGRRWELGAAPIMPGSPIDRGNGVRTPPGGPPYTIPNRTARLAEKPAPLELSLARPLYIGNSAAYAGYAVNNPAATLNSPTGPKTYEQHGQMYKLTAKDSNPDWYQVYTQAGFLLNDITKAFRSVGFR